VLKHDQRRASQVEFRDSGSYRQILQRLRALRDDDRAEIDRRLLELVRRLDAAGVEAEDVSIRRPTLDEVFLAETDAKNDRETEAAA